MLELSTELPFLADSKIKFWIKNQNFASEFEEGSEDLVAFVHTRMQGQTTEIQFGEPFLEVREFQHYIESTYFSSENENELQAFAESWKKELASKTITFCVLEEDEDSIRLALANALLISSPEEKSERIAKALGLFGANYMQFLAFAENRNHKSNHSFANQFISVPLRIIERNSIPKKRNVSPKIIIEKEILEIRERKQAESIQKVKEEPKKFDPEKVESKKNSPLLPGIESKELEVKSPESSSPESLAISDVESKLEEKKVEDPSKPESEKNVDLEKLFKEEAPKTKFSIQLKLMGVISLLFALSVSAIIFFASYYFRYTADLQLRDSNLKIAEVVGLKVKSDITAVVEKGRQIAITLTSQGLPEDQRKLLLDTFFSYDKEFVFLGIYEKSGEILIPKKKISNSFELKNSSLTEEDFDNVVKRNEALLLNAFLGTPVVINTSPGFQEPSFAVAIPASENGELDNILVMIVKLEKILGAFEKKGILTTFMINGDGIVLVHPKEELVLSAANLSELPIVKTMITSPDSTRQLTYQDPETKSPFLGTFRKIGFADIGVITVVPEDKAFEAVYLIQERSLYIMGIGLCFALICVFLFSKTITKPILQLLSATLEIARGNFKVAIKPSTQDEVGLLTRYFIGMGQGLEEREKVKSILGNMIDPVVVQEAMVDLAALKRGSETQITAFFSDVAGFSGISELLTSADLAALLNEYLSAMTLILKQHEGVLDKYIGDAIVGIFNAPVSVSDHQLKAARASVDMIIKLSELRKYWVENNLYSKEAQVMDCRIGLNSGLAKVGFMGTDALASYTMMGDTVNLAARLEAAGKDYGVNILITDSVQTAIQEEMHTRYLDLVRVKGKNEPVRIHELITYKSIASPAILTSSSIYEAGFQAYLEQNWTKAITLFDEAERSKGKKDKACHVLIERCEDYKKSPPGKNWDGVFTRTHK